MLKDDFLEVVEEVPRRQPDGMFLALLQISASLTHFDISWTTKLRYRLWMFSASIMEGYTLSPLFTPADFLTRPRRVQSPPTVRVSPAAETEATTVVSTNTEATVPSSQLSEELQKFFKSFAESQEMQQIALAAPESIFTEAEMAIAAAVNQNALAVPGFDYTELIAAPPASPPRPVTTRKWSPRATDFFCYWPSPRETPSMVDRYFRRRKRTKIQLTDDYLSDALELMQDTFVDSCDRRATAMIDERNPYRDHQARPPFEIATDRCSVNSGLPIRHPTTPQTSKRIRYARRSPHSRAKKLSQAAQGHLVEELRSACLHLTTPKLHASLVKLLMDEDDPISFFCRKEQILALYEHRQHYKEEDVQQVEQLTRSLNSQACKRLPFEQVSPESTA